MSEKESIAFIGISYKIKEEDDEINEEKVRLFGEIFVQNNKDNCKIIINDEEHQLVEYLDEIDNTKQVESKINIKLKIIGSIDMSFMFNECNLLHSITGISNLNNLNITSIKGMFFRCDSLKVIPDISNLNTSKVIDMSNIFCECRALISLPDISNWNTEKVTNMDWIFDECNSLVSLPDISKWNTFNVTSMSRIFTGCKS